MCERLEGWTHLELVLQLCHRQVGACALVRAAPGLHLVGDTRVHRRTPDHSGEPVGQGLVNVGGKQPLKIDVNKIIL